MDHPEAELDDLMKFIKGPDFPTGGIMLGLDGIKKAYETGRGKAMLRARTQIEDVRGAKQQIVIEEIPYEVNKALLVKKIDEIRLQRKQKESPRSETKAIAKDFASSSNLKRTQTHRAF